MKKVYKKALIICCTVMLLSGCQNSGDQKKEKLLKTGRAKLAALSTQNLDTVSQAVNAQQAELKRLRRKAEEAKNPNQPRNYTDVFSNSVIMGDSIAAGLVDYQLLTNIQVIASRGRNVDTIDEDIQKVINLAPSYIFMEYGMNDLQYFRQNTPLFISEYTTAIQKLKTALPNTKIYVNAILPIMQNAINRVPENAGWPNFNAALKQMCTDLGVTYIDNASILTENGIGYNPDGIHPLFAYFPLWLDHMAEVAGL